ncbi:MAG: hypothetical protein QOG50_704 [Actinomycetota bacterium]|nr:hypothetical protein [Actinomycetota bacterium]
MPCGEPASFGARVAARRRVRFITPHSHNPVRVDGYDDPARGGADPAIGELVALHDLTLCPDLNLSSGGRGVGWFTLSFHAGRASASVAFVNAGGRVGRRS